MVTGKQIHRLLTRNMVADPGHPDARTWWSPVVPGRQMGIEIYLPPGLEPDSLDIAIPFLWMTGMNASLPPPAVSSMWSGP